MPRRTDISSICLIGSGPIVIGQACEFDYSGCQALKVLREDGFRTIVVNSNPATIMTDPGFADRTYIEPLDVEGVTDVLRRERPDALLPTLGGQTALNLAIELSEAGILEELGVELIGARVDVIRRAEDRSLFRDAVESCGLRTPRSQIVTSIDQLGEIPAPAVVRPAFTLGGHGGGFAETEAELRAIVERGLRESPITQVLVEESVRGWDEFELEVIRDLNDNVVIVCSIENLDPMGVHTGDSVTVAPADDALGRGLPGAARRVGRDHPGGRRRDGRLEHPVRPQPRDGRDPGDRDEPARLAVVGARLEGDRLPDREGGGEARRRLHAGRDPERPHEDDARELRADARLRRRQVPAVRVREVPGRRRDARHADEVGRRGDGHRPHVHGGVPQGLRLARARPRLGDAVGDVRRHPGRRPPVVQGAARPRAPRARLARHPARQAGRLGRRLDRRRLGHERRRRAPRRATRRASGRPTAASTRAPARSRPARTTTTRPGARRTRRCRRRRSRAS